MKQNTILLSLSILINHNLSLHAADSFALQQAKYTSSFHDSDSSSSDQSFIGLSMEQKADQHTVLEAMHQATQDVAAHPTPAIKQLRTYAYALQKQPDLAQDTQTVIEAFLQMHQPITTVAKPKKRTEYEITRDALQQELDALVACKADLQEQEKALEELLKAKRAVLSAVNKRLTTQKIKDSLKAKLEAEKKVLQKFIHQIIPSYLASLHKQQGDQAALKREQKKQELKQGASEVAAALFDAAQKERKARKVNVINIFEKFMKQVTLIEPWIQKNPRDLDYYVRSLADPLCVKNKAQMKAFLNKAIPIISSNLDAKAQAYAMKAMYEKDFKPRDLQLDIRKMFLLIAAVNFSLKKPATLLPILNNLLNALNYETPTQN